MYSLYIMSSKRSPKFTTTEELCDAIVAYLHKKQNGEKVNISSIKSKNGLNNREDVSLPPMPDWFDVNEWYKGNESTRTHRLQEGPKSVWRGVFTNTLTRVYGNRRYLGKLPGSSRGGTRRKKTRKNQKD
jgi:hypothetical protein